MYRADAVFCGEELCHGTDSSYRDVVVETCEKMNEEWKKNLVQYGVKIPVTALVLKNIDRVDMQRPDVKGYLILDPYREIQTKYVGTPQGIRRVLNEMYASVAGISAMDSRLLNEYKVVNHKEFFGEEVEIWEMYDKVPVSLISTENWKDELEWINDVDPRCDINFKDGYFPLCSVGDLGGYEEDYNCLLVNLKTKEFFTIEGSHCSCYGFEDQFELIPVERVEIFNDKGLGEWNQYSGYIEKSLNYIDNHNLWMK